MTLNQFYLAIEVEAKQLTRHNVMNFWKERENELSTLQARGTKELSAQVVLCFDVNRTLDDYYIWNKQIVILSLVEHRQVR